MKRYLWILLGVFLLTQAMRPTRTVEAVDPAADLITVTQPSAEVGEILRTACYDCHSGQPRYPWYVNITPVNWWLQGHINEGREHFNLSAWGMVSEKKRSHWAEEVIEMVDAGEMPLKSYTWTHAEARLSDAQRQQMVAFFKPFNTMPEDKNGHKEGH